MTDVGVALIAGTVFGFIVGGVTVFLVLASYVIREDEDSRK